MPFVIGGTGRHKLCDTETWYRKLRRTYSVPIIYRCMPNPHNNAAQYGTLPLPRRRGTLPTCQWRWLLRRTNSNQRRSSGAIFTPVYIRERCDSSPAMDMVVFVTCGCVLRNVVSYDLTGTHVGYVRSVGYRSGCPSVAWFCKRSMT